MLSEGKVSVPPRLEVEGVSRPSEKQRKSCVTVTVS